MNIHYFNYTEKAQLGSYNSQKIRALAGLKPVFCCDISEFKGKLLSDEWLGLYPPLSLDQINFNFAYSDPANWGYVDAVDNTPAPPL
jgi:hypothetical protein